MGPGKDGRKGSKQGPQALSASAARPSPAQELPSATLPQDAQHPASVPAPNLVSPAPAHPQPLPTGSLHCADMASLPVSAILSAGTLAQQEEQPCGGGGVARPALPSWGWLSISQKSDPREGSWTEPDTPCCPSLAQRGPWGCRDAHPVPAQKLLPSLSCPPWVPQSGRSVLHPIPGIIAA